MISLKNALPTALISAFLFSLPAAAAPKITVNPQSVVLQYAGSGSAPQQNVTVSSDTAVSGIGFTVNYSSSASGWLSALASTGSLSPAPGADATLQLFINPSALTIAAGTYQATITLTPPGAYDPSSLLAITVFYTVSGTGGGGGNYNETISASSTTLGFSWTPGSAVPPAQAITVATSDNAPFNSTVVTVDGKPWLQVSPSTNIPSPSSISISVNPSVVTAGTYTGTITFTAPNAFVQVTVTFSVGGVGLTAAPGSLTFTSPQGYGPSLPIPVKITSGIPVPIQIVAISDSNWLQVSAQSGTTPTTVNVSVNVGSGLGGLDQGTYTGNVTIQSGPSNSISVPVTLTVGAPAALRLLPSNLTFNWSMGDPLPAAQTSAITSLTTTAQGLTLTSSTTDGGAWLSPVLSSANTPATLTVNVNPANLTVGTYTGIINLTPSVTNGVAQSAIVTLNVKPAPSPVITSVSNAASQVGGAVAPGELVLIKGSHLGPATLTQPTAGAPLTLANTTVTFDGISAPILYVSDAATAVQVPYGISSGTTSLIVAYNGGTSTATKLTSVAAFPGLFTANASGSGGLAAFNVVVNQDGSVSYPLNTPSTPAKRGSLIVLYVTGEGKTSPASIEGVPTPVVQPFPVPISPVSVTIGGAAASSPFPYLGEVPGIISGVMQINLKVPDASATGDTVPVVVTVNGQPTQNNVSIAVQ
jgi:uncharacterized protein (TIGR03437 family)